VVNPCTRARAIGRRQNQGSNRAKSNHGLEFQPRKERRGGFVHGMDWRRGAATSRSTQEARRESAKRPQ
jgi:hypothetical protein